MTGDEFRALYADGRRDFARADLCEANLRGADLRGANLRGADLSEADLSEADLSGADLSGADLRGADLRGANLRGADLCEADLRGADLRGANPRGADLSGACVLAVQGLRWPVYVTASTMDIGCQRHTHAEWRAFADADIDAMSPGNALAFWHDHGPWLLAQCDRLAAEWAAAHPDDVAAEAVQS